MIDKKQRKLKLKSYFHTYIKYFKSVNIAYLRKIFYYAPQ